MKKRKGLSMVEIIISVVLLVATSVILVTSIMHSYKNLMKMKTLTTDSYSMMQETENAVQNIRSELKSETPDLTGYSPLSYDVFGRSVNVYEVLVTGEYGSIWTVVGKNTYEELPTPTITASARLLNGNFPTVSYLVSNLSVKSEEILDDENSSLHLMTTYRWYVSEKGFYISSNDESDYLNSSYYPIFPSDYTAVGGPKGSSDGMNLGLEEYLGRHVLVVATPVATSGKMGVRAISNPVYISGLPVTGNSLKVHLDASLIDRDDYETYLSGSGTVNKWTDFTGNGYDAEAIPVESAIRNRTTEFGESYANVLEFKDGVTMKMDSNLENMSEFTIFVVACAGADSVSNPFISAGNWSLAFDQFKLGENDFEMNGVSDGNWNVLGITVKAQRESGIISVTVNDGATQEVSMDAVGLQINSEDMEIGTDDMEMAEIIIYNEALESYKYGDVLDYLLKKYDLK